MCPERYGFGGVFLFGFGNVGPFALGVSAYLLVVFISLEIPSHALRYLQKGPKFPRRLS
jgi:hypothetical protein